jgi:hypothetical protein
VAPSQPIEFPAAPSPLRARGVQAGAVVTLVGVVLAAASRGLGPDATTVASLAGLLIGLGLLLLSLAFAAGRVRYLLADGVLELRCDPVLTYRIPVTDVRSIERTDLEPTVWSAVRMPGLALFTVLYSDQGAVRMCATRASQDVTLVRTPDATYGLTPENPSALAAAVRAESQRSR